MPISQNKNNLCASIKDIADAITEHGDLVEVCNIARRTIETLLPCEQVTILRNDDEFQHFAVTPALNQGTPFDRLEILIKYDECSWQTILQTKVPMEINTSTLTEALSGSEISLIGSEPCVCLIVPFNWGHNVLGVIHIVRKDSEYIPNERAQVEEGAM